MHNKKSSSSSSVGLSRRTETEKEILLKKKWTSSLRISTPSKNRAGRSPASTPVDTFQVEYESDKQEALLQFQQEVSRMEEDESAITKYSRATLVLGLIFHVATFIGVNSLFHWPVRNIYLVIISTVFTGVYGVLGLTFASVSGSLAVLRNLPRWCQLRRKAYFIRNSITTDVCPFTGDINASTECQVCNSIIAFNVAEIVEECETHPDEETERTVKIVYCPFCLLRYRFIWLIPFSLATILCVLLHIGLIRFPILFYITWAISGVSASGLAFFIVSQLHLQWNCIRMIQLYLRPTRVGPEKYQLIDAFIRSPVVNSPVVLTPRIIDPSIFEAAAV